MFFFFFLLVYESFNKYITTEILDGENKYDADEHGLQDAEKGVIFMSFPPVLYLHLMRFEYDPFIDNSIKFNDRFEYYDEINLKPYLIKSYDNNDIDICNDNNKTENNSDDLIYKLHAVLVHSGDNNSGHYIVYINPKLDDKWFKFDDDTVSACRKKDAIERNYGGLINNDKKKLKTDINDINDINDITLDDHENGNAYLLVYICKNEHENILQNININDIPDELIERFENLDKNELKSIDEELYMDIHIILEEYFEIHNGIGLYDVCKYRTIKILKNEYIENLQNEISNLFKIDKNHFRLWLITSIININNNNKTNAKTNSNSNNSQLLQLNYINMKLQKYEKCQSLVNLLLNTKTPGTVIYLEFLNIDKPLHDNKKDKITNKNKNLIHDTITTCTTTTTITKTTIDTVNANDKNDEDTEIIENSDDNSDNENDFNADEEILIFFKYYDHQMKCLNYICNKKFSLKQKLYDTWSIMNKNLYKNVNTKYLIYLERGNNSLKKLDINDTLEKIIKSLQIYSHGIILVFEEIIQKNSTSTFINNSSSTNTIATVTTTTSILSNQSLSNDNNSSTYDNNMDSEQSFCENYYHNLLNKIKILFLDKNILNDKG